MATKYAVENHEVFEDDFDDKMSHSKATLRTSPKESDEIFILKTEAEVTN